MKTSKAKICMLHNSPNCENCERGGIEEPPMQTPSQVLQQQQKEFEEEYLVDENGRAPTIEGTLVDITGIQGFLANSHSSLLLCLEEWAKEKKCPIKKKHPKECHYAIALSDLLEFLKS